MGPEGVLDLAMWNDAALEAWGVWRILDCEVS